MHHVWTIAWRPTRSCVQSSKITSNLLGLRQAFSLLGFPSRDVLLPNARIICRPLKQKQSSTSHRPFSTTTAFRFQQASPFQKQVPTRAPSELAFQRNDLRPYEVKVIFGPNGPPPALANTLLKILHSRRVNGTLDLELPPKLARQLKPYPDAFNSGLHWLRQEYPLDEDVAILRRIEREEAGQGNEELIQRAEGLGLYKPQSGSYGAKLGEEGDIMGESELQKIRRENEEREAREQKELEEFIEQQQQAREEKGGGLEARREDGLEGMFCKCTFDGTHADAKIKSQAARGLQTCTRNGK